MARKRMIDPGIWQSEDFGSLSTLAQVVWIGLFSNADDEGRGRAKAAYIKSILFPYDENLTTAKVDKALNEIANKMEIVFYLDSENEYYQLTKWDKWQRVDKPQISKLPAFQDFAKIIRRTFDDCSSIIREQIAPKIKEINLKEVNLDKENINACARACEDEELTNAFSAFEEMRNKIKKPLTDKARELIFEKLKSLAPNDIALQVAILEQSVKHCWQDVYELKEDNKPKAKNKDNDFMAEYEDLAKVIELNVKD